MADKQAGHGVDLAALIGAIVAVLLTLTLGQGAWGPLSTIVGLAFLWMLFGFFWSQRPPGRSHFVDWATLTGAIIVLALTLLISPGVLARILIVIFVSLLILFILLALPRPRGFGLISVGLVFSAVVGLVGVITVAQVIQWRWFHDGTSYPDCRSVAVSQATAAVHDLSDIVQRVDVNGNADPLYPLVQGKLAKKGTAPLVLNDSALTYAFDHAYDEAIGDCLANKTFENLWWIGVPFAILTLAWWILSRQKKSVNSNTLGHALLRRSYIWLKL